MILGAVAASPVAPPSDPMDDEFNGAVLAAKWNWRQQQSAAPTFGSGIMTFQAGSEPAAPTVTQIYQTHPGVSIFRARIAGHATANFAVVGMHVRDGTGGGLAIVGFHRNNVGGNRRLVVLKFSSETAFDSSFYENSDPDPDNFQYVEIEVTATHLIFRHSVDNVSFTTLYNQTFATAGLTPSEVGLAVCRFGATAAQCIQDVDWFRRLA